MPTETGYVIDKCKKKWIVEKANDLRNIQDYQTKHPKESTLDMCGIRNLDVLLTSKNSWKSKHVQTSMWRKCVLLNFDILYKSISPIECVPLAKVTNHDSDIVIGRWSFPLMMTSFQGPLLSVIKVREGSKSCRLHSLHTTKILILVDHGPPPPKKKNKSQDFRELSKRKFLIFCSGISVGFCMDFFVSMTSK